MWGGGENLASVILVKIGPTDSQTLQLNEFLPELTELRDAIASFATICAIKLMFY